MSPYADLRASYQPAVARLLTGLPADPQEVADAIYSAVYAEALRFRYVVGSSAQHIAEVRKRTDFEEFERFLCDTRPTGTSAHERWR